MRYAPNNWYWIIGGDEANVWSSAACASIPVDDPGYTAWLAAGNMPSQAATMADLQAVFADQYPAGMLESYCAYKRWVKEQGGITLSSGTPIETDDRSQAKINGTRIVAENNASLTTQWHAADGNYYAMTSADLITMSDELQTHINNCFDIASQTLVGIADGSITTLAQIDAAFDAPITQARKDWLKT